MKKGSWRFLSVILCISMLISLSNAALAVSSAGISIVSDPASPVNGDSVTLSISSTGLTLTDATYQWTYTVTGGPNAGTTTTVSTVSTNATYTFTLVTDPGANETSGTYACTVTVDGVSYSASVTYGGSGGTTPGGSDSGGGDSSYSLTGYFEVDGSASDYSAVTYDGSDDNASYGDITGSVLSSDTSGENVVLAENSAWLDMSNVTLNKTGAYTDGDGSDFYGVNAVVAAQSASTIYLSDTTINSEAQGANNLFSTGTDSVIYANRVTIHSTENSSRGLDATYDGTIVASDLDITTEGDHCAGVATDRGGGYISLTDSTISTAGQGSPVLYSTGVIEVSGITGTASGSQLVGMEGLNNIRIADSSITSTATSTQDDVNNGIILYQSTSGDSSAGTARFEAADSMLSAAISGPGSDQVDSALFYVTNTTAEVILQNDTLNYDTDSNKLLVVRGNDHNSWGTSGSNGGTLTFTAIDQTLTGDISCDGISTVDLYLVDGTVYTGTIIASTEYIGDGGTTLSLSSDSTWVVTGDSNLVGLNVPDGAALVDPDGNSVPVLGTDGTVYLNGDGTSAYTVTVESFSSGDNSELALSISDFTVDRSAFDSWAGTEDSGISVISESTELSETAVYESGLEIASGVELTAPDGYAVTMTVNGINEPIAEGTYEGYVVLSVTKLIEDIYSDHDVDSTQTMTVALSVNEDGIVDDESVTAALVGGTYDDTGADGISITSNADYFGGVRISGSGTYTVDNADISFTGNGGNDFTGIGAALAAVDDATLIVKNSTIVTQGALRGALFTGDNATLYVYDTTITTGTVYNEDGSIASISIPTAGMSSPPTGLGVAGNCRSINLVDSSNAYYYRCIVNSDAWGAMGSDDVEATEENPITMYMEDCTINITNSGYGAYAIGYIWDLFNNCEINAENGMGVIVAAEGSTKLYNGSVIDSERFGIVTHQGMGAVSNIVVTGDGTEINAKYTGIQVKSRASDITVSDGAQINVTNGPMIQALENDDTMAGSLQGNETVTVDISDTTLTGDIVQSLASVPMSVTLTDATVTGAVTTGTPTFLNGGVVTTADTVGIVTSNTFETVDDVTLSLSLTDGSVWTVTQTSYVNTLTVDSTSSVVGTISAASTTSNEDGSVTYTSAMVTTPDDTTETGTYTVTLVPDSNTAVTGNMVTVDVVVSSADVNAVSAYQADISYDTLLLTLVGATGINNFLYSEPESGIIRIVGYGEDYDVGDSLIVATLTFTAASGSGTCIFALSNMVVSNSAIAPDDSSSAVSGGTAKVYVNLTGYMVTFIDYDTYNAAPDGQKVMLVEVLNPADGMTYCYDGTAMYYSTLYGCYVTMVDDSVTEDDAEAGITQVAGTTVNLDYDGDVTENGVVNINDAQLVYNLYSEIAETVTILQRLEADVNGDGKVDSADARAIQMIILNLNG